MNDKDILKILLKKFPGNIADLHPFPSPYMGDGEIRAIVLGADPTHIVDGKPEPLKMVFGLNLIKSPFGIQ